MNIILLKNLQKVALTAFETDVWGIGTVLSKKVVKNFIKARQHQIDYYYKNDWITHSKRVAYLYNAGWSDPIEIDVGIPELGYYPNDMIINGNHRYAAATLMKSKYIKVEICGSLDHAEELFNQIIT